MKRNGHKNRTFLVCRGTGCVSGGGDAVFAALKAEVKKQNLKGAEIDFTGCHGFCQQGPNVVVEPDGIFYTHVEPEDAAEIVSSHLLNGKPVDRLFYRDPTSGQAIPQYSEIKFYKEQRRVILHNCGHINPERIDDYIDRGGYQSLRRVLFQMNPEEVIEEIKRSGLRGRGGAGFPTGVKWEFCRNAHGSPKYVICNADEGDPGAFMDRSILEADPHSVIEGLAICAYAIGSNEGYFYVRAEYPLAVSRLRVALDQARERGFLGSDIQGSGFNFNVYIKEGAGAFVCGEETALIASIESRRGMPRPRPPFPAQSGLDGKP
jgi:(2Fe-2S) ferredoxin